MQIDDGHDLAGSKSNGSLMTNETVVMVDGENEGRWDQPRTTS